MRLHWLENNTSIFSTFQKEKQSVMKLFDTFRFKVGLLIGNWLTKCLTEYRKIFFKACSTVLIMEYENQVFYQTKPVKYQKF